MKQTHDLKLAESLSLITKNIDEVNDSSKKLAEVIEKSHPEGNIPHPSDGHTPSRQAIEKKEGVIFDAELENTLKNMKKQKRFFNLEERNIGDNIRNGFPIEKRGGKKLKINENICNIIDDLQNVFTKTSNIPLKKVNDTDRKKYENILGNLDF